jgi:hypothetical protein
MGIVLAGSVELVLLLVPVLAGETPPLRDPASGDVAKGWLGMRDGYMGCGVGWGKGWGARCWG